MNIADNIKEATLKWNNLPECWEDAPYVGNGMIGTIFWLEDNKNLFFEMGRCDFYDHRNNNYSLLHRDCRLKMGNFTLSMDDELLTGEIQLDLYTACVKGVLSTSSSKADIRVFACDKRDVLVLELKKISGPCNINLIYNPYTCETPRTFDKPKDYLAYPPASFKCEKDICIALQDMPESEKYNNVGRGQSQLAVAWSRQDDDSCVRFYVSICYSYPGITAVKSAVENIEFSKEQGVDELFENHSEFWENYYSKSSAISISDKCVQNYYYLQLYRFASATRSDSTVLDLMGPWYKWTGWPAIWWNLNIQLQYSFIAGSNHPEYFDPLVKLLWDNKKMMAENCELDRDDTYCLDRATGLNLDEKTSCKNEIGNLAYTLYYIWEMYRYTMDDELLKQKILPLMTGALKFLISKTYKGSDGKLHVLPSGSPEYTESVEDCTYTISAIRWLAKTILDSYKRLFVNDEFSQQCEFVLENLVGYPIDEKTGFMVGKDMTLLGGHRHWSHLFMIQPYCEYTFENVDEQTRRIMLKSVDYWMSDIRDYVGHTFVGASSIYSMFGDGEKALKYIYCCLDDKEHFCYNGMYVEGPRKPPVMESPFGLIRSVQDMLLSSYNDVIRIMPALPSEWQNAEYDNLRAQGAFLVSAKAENGKVTYVKIQSLKGEKCVVKMNNLEHLKCNKSIVMLDMGNAEIMLDKGETAVFS